MSGGAQQTGRGARLTARSATAADAASVAASVRELLVELGAKLPSSEAMREAASRLAADPDAGAVVLAEIDGTVVGVLGASWQVAVRVPGPYGLIQELWVHPDHRSQRVGAKLLDALFGLARDRGIERVEVVLPGEGFSHLAATEAFYLDNDFVRSGVRMRRAL